MVRALRRFTVRPGLPAPLAALRASWYQHTAAGPASIAYFSMEFGISEVLPNYSGGLGVHAERPVQLVVAGKSHPPSRAARP